VRISIVTKEWPPDIYGGAGVHVEHLVAQLRKKVEVEVHAFGAPKSGAKTYSIPTDLTAANPAIQTLGVNLEMLADFKDSNVVHSHTWYANMAGHLGSLLHGIPHVVTAHSLEPLRPWKAEQLGGGYAVSSWVEHTSLLSADAVIAVSHGMRSDILNSYPEVDPKRIHVVHNGIDTEAMNKVESTAALIKYGIDTDRPYVLFVGRITRQKGIMHLLRAAEKLPADVALVLCASSPDTPELGQEVSQQIDKLAKSRTGINWIKEQVSRPELIELLSQAAVFACPSIYEPLGIVNLEAMACATPVVATNVGGIPEVVIDGETGYLVNYREQDVAAFENEFAEKLTQVISNKDVASKMGMAGRKRAELEFGWDRIAEETLAVYQTALNNFRK
jgi:starch synthase